MGSSNRPCDGFVIPPTRSYRSTLSTSVFCHWKKKRFKNTTHCQKSAQRTELLSCMHYYLVQYFVILNQLLIIEQNSKVWKLSEERLKVWEATSCTLEKLACLPASQRQWTLQRSYILKICLLKKGKREHQNILHFTVFYFPKTTWDKH